MRLCLFEVICPVLFSTACLSLLFSAVLVKITPFLFLVQRIDAPPFTGWNLLSIEFLLGSTPMSCLRLDVYCFVSNGICPANYAYLKTQ